MCNDAIELVHSDVAAPPAKRSIPNPLLYLGKIIDIVFVARDKRDSLVGHYNSLSNKDAQDSLLAALINVGSVERKHPTPGVVEEAQNPHDHSYKYHVKLVRNGNAVSIQVCIETFLYTYDDTLANKGSNDVVSMISHFIDSFLNPDAIELLLFCDSCAGQNKNWVMFRYMYQLFHIKKHFTKVILTFSIRGHSNMECYKDTGLVNQQFRAEILPDWVQHFEQAQRSTQPFTVIHCEPAVFRNFSHRLDPLFLAKYQWSADHFERSNP
ncbi:voltage-dependent calcium channel unc-36 [Plakobranchus ocellatus]|uniref:Voltage-dependent calcium channel unc-36 n=1 Tax=Plakobranchus ocellatus TaxID=259542 RepID=A0AAV4B9R5_9GAST|nr:voltage-dependent calcium channel unc-36 [Plakobranchus ocellatus]